MFGKQKIQVQVEVSARHCHLSKEDLEKLFGVGYELKKIKQLSQATDFAAEEVVDIKFGPPAGGKEIKNIRVVGPVRKQTQVEISLTDAVGSGVVPPIKLSGDVLESSPVALVGPKGAIELDRGLIVALRHLHCATDQAAKFKLKTGDRVAVRVLGQRPVVFEDVQVRVKDGYELRLHLDTDEGNAAGINKVGEGIIIK